MVFNNECVMEQGLDSRIDDSVAVRESESEIIFYFRPKCYSLDERELSKVINGLIYGGSCSGGSLERIKTGEVRIFLNPMIHCPRDHKSVVHEITETIKNFKIEV